jgi:hypothetical protein
MARKKATVALPATPLPQPDADGVIRIPHCQALEDTLRRSMREDPIRSYPRIVGTSGRRRSNKATEY